MQQHDDNRHSLTGNAVVWKKMACCEGRKQASLVVPLP